MQVSQTLQGLRSDTVSRHVSFPEESRTGARTASPVFGCSFHHTKTNCSLDLTTLVEYAGMNVLTILIPTTTFADVSYG